MISFIHSRAANGMVFLCRNCIPLKIKRSQFQFGRILTVYVHFLPDDLPWANELNYKAFLQLLAHIIINNWDEIEHNAGLIENDKGKAAPFSRMLVEPAENIVVSFTTSNSLIRKSYLQQIPSKWISTSCFPFELSLWIIPVSQENQTRTDILCPTSSYKGYAPMDILDSSDLYG